MSLKANVLIIQLAFDFEKQVVNLGKTLMATGNLDEDLIILNKHFLGVIEKIPEKGFK
ncbi:hypothetical protein [Flavobacterium urumqiense]|uniref:hypothetical protein n=1 Tax=Flavobacterium urumqiense TaxID=935224 RepID=UPI0031344764